MDPDKTLEDIRDAIGGSDYQLACELFESLDKWLSSDGHFPLDWHSRDRKESEAFRYSGLTTE